MQQEAVVLCAYLTSRAQQPTDAPLAHRDPLIEVTLKRYAGVCKQCHVSVVNLEHHARGPLHGRFSLVHMLPAGDGLFSPM